MPASTTRRRRRSARLTRLLSTALTATVATALAVAAPGPATAATSCPTLRPAVKVGDTGGLLLEGAVVDANGRLYVTDLGGGRVLRFAKPGAKPVVVATLPAGSGGGALAFRPDGTLLVGSGADARVLLGDVIRPGAISTLDLTTGVLTQIAGGFSAADGMAVAKDGTVYATNDFASLIGRLSPTNAVDASWASYPSANGAALSQDGAWLYFSRTFVNPGVTRISVAEPRVTQSLLDLTGLHTFDAPDGLTLDSADRPVVPTDVSNEVFRIERPGVTCLLSKGVGGSVLTYGHGRSGFSAGHLYRAGFDGLVYEIPSGFDPVLAARG